MPTPADPDQCRPAGRRRLVLQLATAVVVTAVTLAAGLLVTGRRPPVSPPGPEGGPLAGPVVGAARHPVGDGMLLTSDQLHRAAPANDWAVWSTTDNTGGSGLNTDCQQARFADRHGVSALVRVFTASGRPHREAVQTVEVSRTAGAAERAYRTVVGWYAGCPRSQLVAAYRVDGAGDEAGAFVLRMPGRGQRSYVAAVARSAAVTTSTVVETRGGAVVPVQAVADDLAASVRQLCPADGAGRCPTGPARLQRTLPPASGDAPGLLTAVDLPFVSRVDRPWVGTAATAARVNMAATPCDRTDFRRLGATRATTRTFLVPQARLPQRFGLTETYGTFPAAGRALGAAHDVEQRLRHCATSDRGAHVTHAAVVEHAREGSSYASWRVEVEVGPHRTVAYWTGVARVGRYLAQVTLSPVPGHDVSARAFEDLVTRARDRLWELR